MALGGDLGGLAFGLEAGAFGVEEFEVADGAAVVAGAGEFGGLGGGGEGFVLGGGLFGAVTCLREGGLDVLQGREHGLTIIGDGFLPGFAFSADVGVDEGEAGHGQAEAGADGPDAAVCGEEAGGVLAQKSALAGEADGGEISGGGDADVGIARGDNALGCGDIGAALEDAGGKSGGNDGR